MLARGVERLASFWQLGSKWLLFAVCLGSGRQKLPSPNSKQRLSGSLEMSGLIGTSSCRSLACVRSPSCAEWWVVSLAHLTLGGADHMIELSTGHEVCHQLHMYSQYDYHSHSSQADHGADEKKDEVAAESKLDGAVRKLVKTIFDVSMMKKAMEQQHIDLQKMPLGLVG